MGTEGLKASLVSREVIADSVELAGRGDLFDGLAALGACDKTIPGLHGYTVTGYVDRSTSVMLIVAGGLVLSHTHGDEARRIAAICG
jgi:dihydroxy-acid dehydratase